MGTRASDVKESEGAPATLKVPGSAPRLDFIGRMWALKAIDAWLANGTQRFFHILGEPGSGKTALSRRLVQLSEGLFDYEGKLPAMVPNFIDASHFCTARDRALVNPLTFAERVAQQLAARSDVFRIAMLKAVGAPIDVHQEVGEAHDKVIGVFIQQLNARGASPEDAFRSLVREPLEALCKSDPNERIIILVDALDESLIYTGELGIVPLLAQCDTLPAAVRFILTSRIDPAIDKYLAPIADEVERLVLSADEWDQANLDDIAAYVKWRFASDPVIAPQALALGDEAAHINAVVTTRSGGNFQYARFMLDTVAAGQWTLAELDDGTGAASDRPAVGMDALFVLYMESLTRATTIGKRDWLTQYAPLMESLSAAQETLSRPQLRMMTGQSEGVFRTNLDGVRQFVEEVDLPKAKERGHRLYHQSFADFLRTPSLTLKDRSLDNPFYLTPHDSHARIADALEGVNGGDWASCEDRYALRYAATHFAAASGTDTQPDRHKRSEALIALITDDGFQQAHRTVLRDPVSLRSDFERAVATAAADDHLAAPPLVVRAALAYHALRRADTHPGELFDLARAGDVEGAERRLAMFPADQGWRQCVSLTIAWLAGSQNLAASKAVRDRVVGQGLEPELQLLVARMNADLFQGEAPQLPPLPYPPQESHVIELVQRLMGNAVTGIEPLDLTSMQEHLNAKSPGANADAAPAYLAEVDGPILISHVCDRKDEAANALFARYVAVHASNGYEYYRNRSLWALISPVLSHPDSHWVREQLVVLGSGALSASPVRFVEALPLTVLALLAKLGDVPATSEYEEARDTARKNAAGITSTRGGDPWAYTLRRLVALAEIEAVAHGRPSVATALVSEALALPYGFAGFSSMGRLTLSDMLRIVAPADVASFTAATAAALESAHNVQDFIFCAQATSRVGAVCSWWRETQPNDALPDLVKTLACDRDDPRFAARHVVGEQFARRGKGAQKLPIPDWARSARTIQTLARLYVRPLADFVRHSLEAGHKANDDLPLGFEVRVPDPSFAEMMAARFSADCLASGLPKGKMTRLIQLLAPVALKDPTALDLVLSRLMLAWGGGDAAAVSHVAESIARYLPPEVRREVPGPKIALPA